MWILSRKGGGYDEITNLEPGRNYSFGRGDTNDFVFNSSSVSREQVELVVGSVNDEDVANASYKTPLCIKVLSRAKSTINGTMYRLSKGQTEPLIEDVTKETNIEMVLGTESASPVAIRWVDFNVSTFGKDLTTHSGKLSHEQHLEDLVELRDIGIDLRIIREVHQATHYYTKLESNNKSLKIAVSLGIPILNRKWIDTIKHNKHDVEKWFLKLDYSDYLPGSGADYLLPRPERTSLLKGVNVFVLVKGSEKHSTFIDTLHGNVVLLQLDDYYQNKKLKEDLLIHDMKTKVPPHSKCLIMKFNMQSDKSYADEVNNAFENIALRFNTHIATDDTIWTSIMLCSLETLKLFDLETLKRPIETDISQPEPSIRKRRKYEKVSKTHFFDFGPATQTQDLGSESIIPISATNDDIEEPEIEAVREEISEPAAHCSAEVSQATNENEGKEVTNGVMDEENNKKRPTEEEIIPSKPAKIGKFMPKVSLVDAIKSAKEHANESIKQELGIVDGDDLEFVDNVSNLAIIETIEIKLRSKDPIEYTSVVNNNYNGRKNYKTFKKNQKLKSNVTRSFVDMDTVPINTEISFVPFKQPDHELAEKKLNEDFSNVTQSVKSVVPVSRTLFVDDEDDEDGNGTFSFRTNNYKEKGNRPSNSLFVDEDSQSSAQPVSNRTAARATSRAANNRNYYDDDDDDDDQPRFGFSRAN